MNTVRLVWEPKNKTPLAMIENRMQNYMKGKKSGVSLLGNGTLVFSPNGRDDFQDARQAMEEARFLIDFQVDTLKEGGFLITFHDAIAVFVSHEEFQTTQEEISQRISELRFPQEEFISNKESLNSHFLIGLYARGKLQRDAHHFEFYKRISGT
jgi:hypothetical protein